MKWLKKLTKPRTNWKQIAQDQTAKLRAYEASLDHFSKVDEANLRLIHQLREMDQDTFQISQVAPDWARIRPIFVKMQAAAEERMKTESNRVRDLVVGEIVTAYNEPPRVRTGLPPKNWRLLNQGKPINTIDGEAISDEARRLEHKK